MKEYDMKDFLFILGIILFVFIVVTWMTNCGFTNNPGQNTISVSTELNEEVF